MESKKQTKGELERRMSNALVLVPRDKDYQSIFFDDKGLKLEVTQDFAVVSTMFHKHVFNNICASGISMPYVYVRRMIEIANENNCMVTTPKGEKVRSYSKLFDIIKNKEDKTEYNTCWFIDLWLTNIFEPLYSIGETEAQAFIVYEAYMHNIAKNHVMLQEKTDDMTNKQFIDSIIANITQYASDMEERVIFPKKTDEEKMQEEISAFQEHEQEKLMEEQADVDNE